MKSVDLHLHTIYSDGTTSPSQIIKDCALNRIETIALADHDTTFGFEEAQIEAKKYGIEVITGVEISTPKYHILGYDFDINNKNLQDALAYSRDQQEEIVKKRIEKIREYGFPLTLEKIKHYSPNARLGKGNIAFAMVYDKECREKAGNTCIEELIRDYMKIKYDTSIKELTPEEAIYAIKQAGGIAILAHPFKDIKKMSRLDRLVSLGLDGIEIQPTFGEKNNAFLEYANEKNLIVTYGSDFHGSKYINRPMLDNSYKINQFWRK